MLNAGSGGPNKRRAFRPVLHAVDRLIQRFDGTCPDLGHVVSIASDAQHLRPPSPRRHCRLAPCPWGVRRDEYLRKGKGRVHRESSRFRRLAADATTQILAAPEPAWDGVLPGDLKHVIGKESTLFLAEYWTLMLHHMVWSRQLPYVPQVRWLRGCSIDSEPFCFVSRLPIDLREASIETLMLLQERAKHHPEVVDTPVGLVEADPPPFRPPESEPPESSETPECSDRLEREESPTVDASPSASDDEMVEEHLSATKPQGAAPDHAPDSDGGALVLNVASFEVRLGAQSFRFRGRNKLLFALLERIARRPGHRVLFDDLRAKGDVWDGSRVEDSTIRGAFTRLRKVLRDHGMESVASRIVTGTYRNDTFVILHDDQGEDWES